MARISRRCFLAGSAAAGGLALAGPFAGFVAGPAAGTPRPTLGPIPDLRDGQVRLWLPEGFRYRSFHDTEQTVVLDDGTVLPGRHDGMAAFRSERGNVVLVRNHEVNNPIPAFGDPADAYDAMAGGGTTTIEVTRFGEVVTARTSLNGTQMNCSGGRMPWGSWITCEETVNGPDVGPDFTGVSNVPLTRPHGYIFEVPAGGESDREPITAAGRFPHEAVAFDPQHGVLYMTEDNFGFSSGSVPVCPPPASPPRRPAGERGTAADAGRRGHARRRSGGDPAGRRSLPGEVGRHRRSRSTFPFTPGQPAPTTNDEALNYVSEQGRAQGAAGFSRLEGATYDRGTIYFCSTQGGGPAEPGPSDTVQGWGNGFGQIWAYDISSDD